VIPKPPFACDLDLDTEIAAFDALKPRLAGLWSSIFPGDEEHYTSVVIPSLTLDQGELRKLPGAPFYEERLLFLLIRLRNPRARMVYVTSQPIHPLVLEYYFQFLAGIPTSHARSRLTLVCAHDASPVPLTQKILERPRLIERIRVGIPDPTRAYMTVFNSTPFERKLAVLLGIPLNGVDPRLSWLGSKSGSRKVFREAGVDCPVGMEDLRTPADVERALGELRRMRPGLRRAVVKLNESFSGEGNAIFQYPEAEGRDAIQGALRELEFAVPAENHESYFEKFRRMGGIVEELVEQPGLTSPSAQLRINPRGQVVPIATHDQILGGPHGHTYVGCRFPAAEAYRQEVQDAAVRIGSVLAAKGVVSRFSIDFLACPDGPGAPRLQALEINLRMGATTHPFLALRFLTGGHLDPGTGLFLSPDGLAKYYRATDNLQSEAYRGLLPEDLIDIVTFNRLHYDHASETGVLFHLMGALSEFGKVGLTAIGNSPEQADAIYSRTVAVLDKETVYGRKPARAVSTGGPSPGGGGGNGSDEIERRQPRQSTLGLDAVLDAFARNEKAHLSGGAASEEDLRRFEERAGIALPLSFRAFLSRFGGGLYFHGHEIFGPQHVVIHDIELVPDLLTVRKWLAAQGIEVPGDLVPFHRARGVIHLLDVRPEGAGRVLTLGGPATFPDLAGFLETLVLPRAARSAPPAGRDDE
jgi:hypothetical protein